jgi:hypothetical protein
MNRQPYAASERKQRKQPTPGCGLPNAEDPIGTQAKMETQNLEIQNFETGDN